MEDNGEDRRLNKELIERISSLEPASPWVWQLKLSESEFNELESAVSGQSTSILHEDENWAKALLVYVAEWYKRRYQSGNSCPLLEKRSDIKLENAWKSSGFAWKKLVYTDEGGKRRWLYSAYVLGGLAVRHELSRNDQLRFLKALCRIYHHEDYTLENLEDASRAVSFRDSIQRKHSLHHYMQEILNGKLPFNAEDLADSASEVNRFVTAMKSANDEVMHDKFRFEWVITNTPGIAIMSRVLRLWLRPEEVRGGLHQYLRFDRMVLWGIKKPQALQSLKVGVRYLHGGDIVSDVNWNNASIVFTNTGEEETGFLAVGVERCAISKDVPTQPFDTILVVARDNNGKEYELQREKAPDLLQVWREVGDRWSSLQNAQRDTAVLFSPDWHLKLDNTSEQVEHKPFRSPSHDNSEPWGWYPIYDKVTLTRGDEEITLYNRQGYDRIATHLYLDTIQYENGGYVNFTDSYGDEELLPLIFGCADVIARHFATKDDITNAQPDEDTEIELIEYKQGAYYTEWTADNQPPFGKVTLRLTVKGRQLPFAACYLPRLNGEHPIVRDFEQCAIRYATIGDDGNIMEQVVQDHIPMDYKPLKTPTISLHICNAEVKVYHPTLIKVVYLDENITCYLQDGEPLNLPYIFKRRVAIEDYSRQGYRRYNCNDLATVFAEPFINIVGNPNAGMAALVAWEVDNKRYPATMLDALAPDYLFITFGNPKGDGITEDERFCFWNYAEGTAPIAVAFDDNAARDRWGIIFHDLQGASALTCRFPLINDDDTWAEEYDDISEIDCFLQAVVHGVYFFLFMPLRNLDKSDYVDKIYRPLLELRGGTLTEQDLDGLQRFAEEFDINYYKTFKI